MIIVLDPNVLVSGLLKGRSNPGIIVNQVASGRIRLAYDFRIIDEYRRVLKRPRFNFRENEIEALLKQIEAEGLVVTAAPLALNLPDPADRPFWEVAAAGEGFPLVTGNRKHYPPEGLPVIKVLSPAEFIQSFLQR